MPQIYFEILGEPQGKGRPRFKKMGNFVKTFTPEETQQYEDRVIYACRMASSVMFGVKDQIKAKITAYYQIPKSCYVFHKKTNTTDLTRDGEAMLRGELRPTKKPDTDNIAKICLDALNGIAYHDDSQIVSLQVEKFYSEKPRVCVLLWGGEEDNEEVCIAR